MIPLLFLMTMTNLKKSIISICLLGFLFTMPSAASCQDSAISKKAILEDLQRGFWLNKTYLNRLIKTKSPRKAGKKIIESGFQVIKENDKYRAVFIFRFHDTGAVYSFLDLKETNAKNVYELEISRDEDYLPNRPVRVLLKRKSNGDEIWWTLTSSDKKNYDLVFVRVEPTVDQFVNRTLLSGEYRDKSNRTFKFTEAGMSIWPDKTFKYEIDLNMKYDNDVAYEPTCDDFYYMEMKGRKVQSTTSWDFSIQGNKLIIYEPNVECSKKILYTLEKIK